MLYVWFSKYHVLVVDKKLQKSRVNKFEVLEDSLKLLWISRNKVAVQKACALVENIIIRHWVKIVPFCALIIFLKLVEYHEGDIAEWQGDILAVDQPVMVFVVEPMTLLVVKGALWKFLAVVLLE